MRLRIGTRGSRLALAQSRWVKEQIEGRHPRARVDLVQIRTRGDKILDSPLSEIGGKGLFVKEIEEALLQQQVDLAVHSLKDVPAQLPAGLTLCAYPAREDPHDALVTAAGGTLEGLPRQARVGTGSLRRAAQLLHLRPDLQVVPLRGNVDTRLRKLGAGEFDALILAAAGLKRLGISHHAASRIPSTQVLPAVGQGVLALETRAGDERTMGALQFLNDEATAVAVRAERGFLAELGGGCQVPIAGLAQVSDGGVHLQALVAELDGSRIFRDQQEGSAEDAERIGRALARRLLAAGAAEVLRRIYAGGMGDA